jgi:hypothetical protein
MTPSAPTAVSPSWQKRPVERAPLLASDPGPLSPFGDRDDNNSTPTHAHRNGDALLPGAVRVNDEGEDEEVLFSHGPASPEI